MPFKQLGEMKFILRGFHERHPAAAPSPDGGHRGMPRFCGMC
ncbi:hypothetical protein [Paenibacillus cremeus]|nr:hypothetical protein [Paenibacillus cremeus]